MPVIAVDGPGGAGKGTLCRGLARALGWDYLDSGALYRLLALKLKESHSPLEAAPALAAELDIAFSLEDNGVSLDGQPVADRIRNETIGALASEIAALPAVRAALLQRQRDFDRAPGLVADGRDMGTVVFPQAELKIFLDASAEVRARRREAELLDAGKTVIFEKIFREIRDRDERDRNREIAPLRPAPEARVLDSTGLDAGQVLQLALQWAREIGLGPPA